MRTALATTIAAAILTALWSAHRFTAKPPGVEQLATTSSSIDVMQMMKDARNLPEEAYNAH
jgi:hypothetical protein